MDLTLPIRAVESASSRSRILRLDLEGRPFSYRAGQGVLLGRPGQPVRRPYSLASAPHETERSGLLDFLVSVDEDGTPGTHMGDLRPGLPVAIDGPIGTFVLPDAISEPHLLFVAGGTGIAPLRSLLAEALQRHPALGASVLYTARASGDFAFERELRSLAERGSIRFHQTVTRDAATGWAGERGRVDRARLAAILPDTHTLCFVCGPHGLVQDVPRMLEELGVLPQRIKIEEWAT